MITITDLHKRFKTFEALKGISLNVRAGEIYGFIGKNGAGKSTTMNILAGLSRPTSGECIVNGQSVTRIVHPSDLKIGYLPEDPRFYPWMTGRETLDFLGNGNGHSASRQRIDEMLDWVGLTGAAGRRVGGYSRGMKQRLGIGAALIHNPELVILDEPSSALDPEGRRDVLDLIVDLKRQGKTVFFSTHILSDVERICDTVGMIADGRMVMEKPLAHILKENAVPIFDIVLKEQAAGELTEPLAKLDQVHAVAADGASLAVTVADADDGARALMHFLAERNLAVARFELRQNDLEDLFIQEVNGK